MAHKMLQCMHRTRFCAAAGAASACGSFHWHFASRQSQPDTFSIAYVKQVALQNAVVSAAQQRYLRAAPVLSCWGWMSTAPSRQPAFAYHATACCNSLVVPVHPCYDQISLLQRQALFTYVSSAHSWRALCRCGAVSCAGTIASPACSERASEPGVHVVIIKVIYTYYFCSTNSGDTSHNCHACFGQQGKWFCVHTLRDQAAESESRQHMNEYLLPWPDMIGSF
jgi:hypothetical protein